MGVTVDAYHTDNGIFKSKAFTQKLHEDFQSIRFSGVGAKWQNGAAESAIGLVSAKARTMMIYAHMMWPDAKDESLWPLAVSHAAYLYNNLPNEQTGIAPIEIFSQTQSDYQAIRNAHPWGCPAYVLSPKLTEAGGKIPKWEPRSRRGQYVGVSPVHAENVSLIRNLSTGYLSPQFHVVHDDWFETCYSSADQIPPQWEDMCIFDRCETSFDQFDKEGLLIPPPPLADEWLSPEELDLKRPSNLRQGRTLYQDLHVKNKEIKEDLHYDPPPPVPIVPRKLREPPDLPREPIGQPREASSWHREKLTTPSPAPSVAPQSSRYPTRSNRGQRDLLQAVKVKMLFCA